MSLACQPHTSAKYIALILVSISWLVLQHFATADSAQSISERAWGEGGMTVEQQTLPVDGVMSWFFPLV